MLYIRSTWRQPDRKAWKYQDSLSGGCKEGTKSVVIKPGYSNEVHELSSDHEEADCRMFVNIAYSVNHDNIKTVVIMSPDTDVAVVGIHQLLKIEGLHELYFFTGIKCKKRFIHLRDIVRQLGLNLSAVLPILNSLTGCDTTSYFGHHGEKKQRLK